MDEGVEEQQSRETLDSTVGDAGLFVDAPA